jgi:hypothetical protein
MNTRSGFGSQRLVLRLQAMALSLAFCCCALAPALAVEAPATPPEVSTEVDRAMEFLFAMTRADQLLRESMVEAADSERAKEIAIAALADTSELRRLFGAAVASQISAADLRAVDTFLQSEPGQVLKGIFLASVDDAQIVAAMNRLSPAQQEQINTFIVGAPMSNLIAALGSEQTMQAARDWGVKITCDHVAAHPELYDPGAFERIGECK